MFFKALILFFVSIYLIRAENGCNYLHFAKITTCFDNYFEFGGVKLSSNKTLPNFYELNKIIYNLEQKAKTNGTQYVCGAVDDLKECLSTVEQCLNNQYFDIVKYDKTLIVNAVNELINFSIKQCTVINIGEVISFDIPSKINCFAMIITESFMAKKDCIERAAILRIFESKEARITRITNCMVEAVIEKCGNETADLIERLIDTNEIKIRIPEAFD
uniref:DUF19 domain-containing protein n=1 Tax=Rhabditophanes sp. KR3021 TaxID=114890 RepID=A0AC35UDA6_9BILA